MHRGGNHHSLLLLKICDNLPAAGKEEEGTVKNFPRLSAGRRNICQRPFLPVGKTPAAAAAVKRWIKVKLLHDFFVVFRSGVEGGIWSSNSSEKRANGFYFSAAAAAALAAARPPTFFRELLLLLPINDGCSSSNVCPTLLSFSLFFVLCLAVCERTTATSLGLIENPHCNAGTHNHWK